MSHSPLTLDYRPRLPRTRQNGIAIIGAGGIVNYAHLPAYRKAGFPVIGITDLDPEKARATARTHQIPHVFDSVADLLRHPEVSVVDIAVYPDRQPELVRQAAAAGKHMLCQKPLATNFQEAAGIVACARDAGVQLAVNQQMRWDAGMRYASLLMQQGWIGQPVSASIQVHVLTPWHMWPWIYSGQHVDIMFHSIHYIDTLRFLLGQPDFVFTSGTHMPADTTQAETKTVTVWEYASGLQVLIDVNHHTWQDDFYATYRIEGTDGVIKGTIGLLYDYPHGRPDTLECMSRHHHGGAWMSIPLEDLWIPDAFIGPMASLLCALEDGSQPETSGDDNLKTLQIVFAQYQSMAERRAVRPAEIGQNVT